MAATKTIRHSSSENTKGTCSILLLTNRDSDNVGDQVIEACNLSLIRLAMRNLGYSEQNVHITSKAIAIISDKYCSTKDSSLLKAAKREIEKCDVVLFGGAPVFNFAYQNFYLKTATILTLARQYGKPVLFSAVGIDSYSDTDPKCQLLKDALHNGSVKQITTRDGIEHLKRYIFPSNDIEHRLVPDPAVYTKYVFKPFTAQSHSNKVGIFVFRAGGFKANGISFPREKQALFWSKLCKALEDHSIKYELLTSGHFADEAFLDYLAREGYVKAAKCRFNVNCPEDLICLISSYKSVVSCRLHPSIISYSLDIPSVSLIWNQKVTDFYTHIGYPERAVPVSKILADNDILIDPIIDMLLSFNHKSLAKDTSFIYSFYETLYFGLAKCLTNCKKPLIPFSCDQLAELIPPYPGTTDAELDAKIERKFRRAYRNYNASLAKNLALKHRIQTQETLSKPPVIKKLIYHSGAQCTEMISPLEIDTVKAKKLPSGCLEFCSATNLPNDGSAVMLPCQFSCHNKRFLGWHLRVKIDNRWYWCLDKGGLISKEPGNGKVASLLSPGDHIPQILAPYVEAMVAEGVWESLSTGGILRHLLRNGE